jgi:membrane-bound serine protease (ClpP class)
MPSINVMFYLISLFVGVVILVALTIFYYMYDLSRRPVSGRHILLGQIGRAKQDIPRGKLGKVYVFGEYWEAISDEELKRGQAIRVVEVHDKFLKVVPTDMLPDTT